MSNPTSNFGWVMPTATDLVTDLPADFAVFGQAVDTSMADLLGGTTGQVLSKTSGTNMDFTWVAANPGDITAVGVTSPINGGGTSGSVTIGIDDATTLVKGAVQLSDSTSTTSSVLAATPTAVKSAYDLANGAIAKTTVTTAGDIIYRNATVPARLGIGTAGQVLTVNSGATAPEWSSPAGGGKVLQVVSSSYSTAQSSSSASYIDTGLTATITPTLNTSKILVLLAQNGAYKPDGSTSGAIGLKLLRAGSDIAQIAVNGLYSDVNQPIYGATFALSYYDAPATTSATIYKTQFQRTSGLGGVQVQISSSVSTITLLEIGA
jgi:hypothetical protein